MRKQLLVLAIAAAFSGSALAADPVATATGRIDALEARVKALEAQAEAMRKQAEEATAALAQTRAELQSLRAGASDDAVAAQPGTSAESVAAGSLAADVSVEAGTTATSDVAAAPESSSASAGSGKNAFNPAITIVLNGSASSHSVDPELYERSGFPLIGEGRPSARGFSLGESEISFAATVDDKFYGQLTLAVGSEGNETELGIEEAFIDATALPGGVALRAGRFFSNIGYLNSRHAHTDKFFDRPLPYQAFLGNQYGDDGVQLRWVAPTETFLELGGEVLRGDRFAGGEGRHGAGTGTLFAHFGGDVGDESAWLAGVSMLRARSEDGEDGFSGDISLYIADLTWKWAPQGNFKEGGVSLRAEYFHEDRDGDYFNADDPSLDQPWNGKRSGAYAEATWRLNRWWELGGRYDWLDSASSGPYAAEHDPSRGSIAITWLNSEFSLLRLQYSYDQPNPDQDDSALTLQYQVNMGAHGAHKF